MQGTQTLVSEKCSCNLCICSLFWRDTHSEERNTSLSPKVQYTFLDEFREDEACLDVSQGHSGAKITLYGCHDLKGNQEFKYTKVMRNEINDNHSLDRLRCKEVKSRHSYVCTGGLHENKWSQLFHTLCHSLIPWNKLALSIYLL